jgi:Ras GTPase-activating-like protein IQGAP2/3
MDVLEHGFKFATEQKNTELSNNISQILLNISKLEAADRVTKDDNYDSFVHDVALEVINRNAIRNHQKKEIERLERTLGSLRSHQAYLEEQIKQYKDYLQDCKNSFYNNPRNKKGKGKKGKKGKKGADSNRVGYV